MYMSPVESSPYLLTASSDMRIRYWDLINHSDTYIMASAANDRVTPSTVSYRYGNTLYVCVCVFVSF